MMATVFISSKHVAARIEMEERKVGRNRVSPHFLHFLANSFGVAQLKLARCPHSLTASLAATPVRLGPLLYLPRRSIREGGSLIPFAPFVEVAADLKRTTSAAVLKLDCLNNQSSKRLAKNPPIVSSYQTESKSGQVLPFSIFQHLWIQRW